MTNPFSSFLGEEPSAASGGMSPNAAGQPAPAIEPQSPQDAQPVENAPPLAVPASSAPEAAPVVTDSSTKLKMGLGLLAAGVLAYWLFKGKKS